MYITEVKGTFEGDAFFPEFDKNEWKEIERIPHGIDEKHQYAFDFVTYARK
ncbi:MAG: dihydrofolate reductase [Fulvivirga sp.]